jgi:hypothetical protein
MTQLQPVHVRLRHKLCETCPSQCAAYLHARLVLEDREAVCELNRWPKVRTRGLGDAVAFIAQPIARPIARAIDAVAGTKIVKCGGCAKRREWLNQL